MDQGPNGALKAVCFKHGYNFVMNEPRDPKFFLKIEHQKIFDTCLGVFQNLDQEPNGALKLFFLNMARALDLQP